MIENIKIYISTSDNYHHCLQPFAYLFNKFWSSDREVNFIGYKKPNFKLPSNFNFISLGVQRGPKYYAEDLRTFFETIDESHFIYTMEDQFILDYVDLNMMNDLTKHLKNDKVGRICLTNSIFQKTHEGKRYQNFDRNIIELTQDSNWRITCEWSLWKKEYMLKYLQKQMTPWEFERQSFSEAMNDGYHVIGFNEDRVLIHHAEAIRAKYWGRDFDFKFVHENRYLNDNIITDMKMEKII